jgi:hypothetical protein
MYKNGSIIVTGHILDNETNGTITFLPVSDAFNVVKYYGYSVDDVTTSGMGNEGSPTGFKQ